MQDITYAFRALRRAPALTLTAVATLALGVGATAAVCATIDLVSLRTPPGVVDAASVKRLEQRFTVALTHEHRTRGVFSFPEFEAFAALVPDGVQVGAYATARVSIGDAPAAPERVVASVAGSYFGVLGVVPTVGRLFVDEERDGSAPNHVAVISSDLWARQYDRSPDVLGEFLRLGTERYEIVGVAAKGFRGVTLERTDVWIPFGAMGDSLAHGSPRAKPYDLRLNVFTRVSTHGEASVVQRADRALRSLNVVRDPTSTVALVPVAQRLSPETREGTLTTMGTLLASVTALLLVACANIGNVLAMRSWQRRRETAIRVALGISPTRLARQILIEGLILGAMAGMVALLLTFWTGTALGRVLVPEMVQDTSLVDVRTGAIGAVLGLLAGALTGAITVLYARRSDVAGTLRALDPATGQRSARLRTRLALIQTTLSTALIAVAGLFVQSFRNVARTDIGYHYDNVWVTAVPFSTLMDRPSEVKVALRDAATRITRITGVEEVALAFPSPLQAVGSTPVFLPGRDSVPSLPNSLTAVSVVSPEFVRVMGLRVIQGRAFGERDDSGGEPVVMVSSAMARLYWPGQQAIGRCLIIQQRTEPCRRVVGVVDDVNATSILEGPSLRFYIPLDQAPQGLDIPQVLLVRTDPVRQPSALARIREAIDDVDHGRWRWNVRRFADLLEPELRPWRTTALLFSLLGALTLSIAGIGVYGTVAYATAQRTREIGVRRALGAHPVHVLSLVVSETLEPVAIGGTLGLGLAVAVGYFARSRLHEVTAADARSLVTAAAILVLSALIACLLPAVRALRVDPVIALRSE